MQRQAYYQALTLPLDAETFITNLQQKMSQAMHELDQGMPKNQQVSILSKRNGSLKVSPFRGEGTTTCASDSKKFGAWDQNLMTEWHIRYGGRGVMI